MVAAYNNQLEVVRYLREVVGEDAATTNKVREREREFLAELPVQACNGPCCGVIRMGTLLCGMLTRMVMRKCVPTSALM